MPRAKLTAFIDGVPFAVPESTRVTVDPLSLEMARELMPWGEVVVFDHALHWFGKPSWLPHPLMIPLKEGP